MSNVKKKVLLMGKSGSGKTSMRSVIFSNMLASSTSRLQATIDVEHSQVRFFGSLYLNLWDCGGQENFLDNYVSSQKSQIFTDVAIFIFVFDATVSSNSPEWAKDVQYFLNFLEALRSNEGNDGAGVFVLINKMDLIGEQMEAGKADEGRRKVFEEKREELDRRSREVKPEGIEGKPIRCFGTSIWDESLYKAWSSAVHTIIPNNALITSHLTHLRNISSCVEAVLFEKQTFLVIAKSGSELDSNDDELDGQEIEQGGKGLDRKRFEKISEIVKGFRQTCSRIQEPFRKWEARFDNATVALDVLSSNTFLMLVSTEPWVEPALLMYNIEQARPHFEDFGVGGATIKKRCLVCKAEPDCNYEPEGKEGDVEWGNG